MCRSGRVCINSNPSICVYKLLILRNVVGRFFLTIIFQILTTRIQHISDTWPLHVNYIQYTSNNIGFAKFDVYPINQLQHILYAIDVKILIWKKLCFRSWSLLTLSIILLLKEYHKFNKILKTTINSRGKNVYKKN